jgi:hypothetical protein
VTIIIQFAQRFAVKFFIYLLTRQNQCKETINRIEKEQYTRRNLSKALHSNAVASTTTPINNNNNNNNNSSQFSGYLLTCRLNSTSASYKASTKTQIKHKNSKNTQDQTLKKQNKTKQICSKTIKRSTGQKSSTLTKHR